MATMMMTYIQRPALRDCSFVAKSKPRTEVLMTQTFPNRWDSYVNQSTPNTLLNYLGLFPLLRKTTYVSIILASYISIQDILASIDFSLACKKDDLRDNFEEKFPLWARSIIKYCKDGPL